MVSLAGLGVAGIGLLGVASPSELVNLLARWRVLTGLPATLALRLGFGALFLLAAPSCRSPHFVRLVGVLEFAGVLVLVGLGAARLRGFVEWWLGRSPSFVRRWCFAAVVFGVLLAYAGA
jgi:hypothetical protein